MRVHFLHRHVLDTLVILGEGNPSHTVPLIRHAGPLASTERKGPCHRTVRQMRGVEEVAVSRGGIEGDHGEGL